MNMKEMAGYLASLEAVLAAVPGLVDEKHSEKLHRLRGMFEMVLQITKGNNFSSAAEKVAVFCCS